MKAISAKIMSPSLLTVNPFFNLVFQDRPVSCFLEPFMYPLWLQISKEKAIIPSQKQQCLFFSAEANEFLPHPHNPKRAACSPLLPTPATVAATFVFNYIFKDGIVIVAGDYAHYQWLLPINAFTSLG